jgi:hypothetical protein
MPARNRHHDQRLGRRARRAPSANPSERYPTVEILKQDRERFMSARPQLPQAAA